VSSGIASPKAHKNVKAIRVPQDEKESHGVN